MRIVGWESLLAAYIENPQPFEWGKNDCALWSAAWVKQCTGHDFISKWIGKYKTEKGAATLMKKRGYRHPADIADDHLVIVPAMLARRGDLVLHPAQDSLGICNGLKSYFLTQSGYTAVNTNQCRRAWRVD